MVLVLIIVDGRPIGVDLLVYATVVITVLSGADYFFGLRRLLTERHHGEGRRRGSAGRPADGA
jgi:CDP-diacylglycerol---glycerol-3-phosphate 3-phosphatidyltransferase